VAFESSSLGNILAMVSAGAGISLVPEIAVVKRGRCRFIPVEDSPRTAVGWAMLRKHKLSSAQELFVETVARGRRVHNKNGAHKNGEAA
jgi:DNA-binding transcriptional LysR family regulator